MIQKRKMLSNGAPSPPSKCVPSGKFILGCCLRLEFSGDFCGSPGKLLLCLHMMLTVVGSSFVLHEIVKIDSAADMLQISKPIAGALSHFQLFHSH